MLKLMSTVEKVGNQEKQIWGNQEGWKVLEMGEELNRMFRVASLRKEN